MAIRADEVDLDRDRELVERYQAGDLTAFDDLYQRYFQRLRQFCLRRVGDPHEAEELAQEAFARALRALPRFAGERRFYPWMTVIAQRLCVDHHRRLWRVSPAPEIDPGLSIDDDHDGLFAEADLGYLGTALERLAPRHREILQLREQEGLSYQQIADRLDVPITTVEALLHRARKALRREFSALGGGRLAGIPVLGWLLREMQALRIRVAGKLGARVNELGNLGGLAAPMTAGAMTLALAVAPAFDGGVNAPASTPASVERLAPVHAPAAPSSVPGPVVVARRAPRPVPGLPSGPASTEKAGTVAAPTRQSPPGGGSGTEHLGPIEHWSPGTDSPADDQPVVVQVGPVTIGAAPDKVTETAHDVAEDPVGMTSHQIGGKP